MALRQTVDNRSPTPFSERLPLMATTATQIAQARLMHPILPVVAVWLMACSVMVRPAWGDWKNHQIRQGDGKGGWVARPAQRQVLRHPDSEYTMPFGLAQMDNGEIAIIVSREKANSAGGRIFEPNIAFSKDGGATWSTFQAIPGTKGRPQFLYWLGSGRLSFVTETFDNGKQQRFFSSDYGRTWKESVDHPATKEGRGFGIEGNGWIDRGDKGAPKAILEIGYHLEAGKTHPTGDFTGVFRRSLDGGKFWIDEVSPPQWKFTVEHNGKKWLRGVSEGAVVRAANGDLVAALRTDMPPKYFGGPHDDSLEGTAISISKDDGKTWSDPQFLFEAGRHHANLQRMPNGDLVCTLVVRDDIQAGNRNKGELTSHRRGCDALISHDHGQTWNLDRRYELDSFEFLRKDGYWVDGVCGHIGAVVLKDGYVLSVYGNYPVGAVLIKWRPEEFRLLPMAPQKVHSQAVPHLNRKGERLMKYTPGESFFPIGLYHGLNYEDSNEPDHGTLETPLDKVAQANFNYVHTNRALSRKYLDRLQQHGLMLVKSEARPSDAEAFGRHAAILAWDVFDEPDSDGNFAAYPGRFNLFDQFKTGIRQHDLVRPVFVNTVAWIRADHQNRPWWIKWHQAGDLSCHDNYPVVRGSNVLPTFSELHGIPETTSLGVEATSGKKPVWVILQAFGQGEGGRWRMPSARETRTMAYSALVHGATGLCWFQYDNLTGRQGGLWGISPQPQPAFTNPPQGLKADESTRQQIKAFWNTVVGINAEVSKLTPFLLSPTAPLDYQVLVGGTSVTATPIRTLLKEYGDRHLLIIVNVDNAELDVRIALPQALRKARTRRLFGELGPTVAAGRVEIRFAPHDVAVYEFAKNTD